MTHVSRAAVVHVHVIGFSFPKAYTLHSTVGYSVVPQQIGAKAGNFMDEGSRRAVSRDAREGLTPTLFLQLFLRLPLPLANDQPGLAMDPLPQRTRRTGDRHGKTRRASRLFPFLLEAGQAEVGPLLVFLCAHVPFFSSLAPFPIALVPLQIIAGDCAQSIIGSKHLIGI